MADLGNAALLPLISRAAVIVGWVIFFLFFVVRHPTASGTEAKRDPVSRLGIFLQMISFAMVWAVQRPLPSRLMPLDAGEIVRDVAAPVVSIASIALGLLAVRTLGRQWSYTARLVDGHELITTGPYGLVRHPIYTGMLGKLVATSLAFGHWIMLPIALAVFLAGTIVRVRSEETLLRGAFGARFEEYARKVPAFIPFLR